MSKATGEQEVWMMWLVCALALGGVLAGYPTIATWALAILKLVGNIYVLVLKPLYRLEPPS